MGLTSVLGNGMSASLAANFVATPGGDWNGSVLLVEDWEHYELLANHPPPFRLLLNYSSYLDVTHL